MLPIKKLAITGILNAMTNYTGQPKSIYNKPFFTFLSECTSNSHCKGTNKNTCNFSTKKCVCNAGFYASGSSCYGMVYLNN